MKRINNLEGILPLISSFKALRDIQGFDLNYDQKRLFNNAVLLQLKTHIDWKNLSATEAFELGNTVDCFYDRDIQYALRQLRSHICGQYRFDEAQIIHIGKHWVFLSLVLRLLISKVRTLLLLQKSVLLLIM